MLVNHELPLHVLDLSRSINDYEFVLPHLLDQNKAYAQYMIEAKEAGRYMIMDNSLHELGEAYNFDRLKEWVHVLQPDEFIVPDVWENKDETLAQAKYWMAYKLANEEVLENTTFTAVVQAKSYEEALMCYLDLKELGYKKICFSYGAEYYRELYSLNTNPSLAKALGRIHVVLKLIEEGIIEENDRIHLLGCQVPQEFGFYNGVKQIETIDTSNPVMAAVDGIEYGAYGLYDKPKSNLNSCFTLAISKQVKDRIINNVKKFKQINNI